MSKKKLRRRIKKARRAKRAVQQLHDNRHHLCFQRRHWEKNPYARFIRNNAIFTISVEIHNEYHHTIGKDIPIPEDIAEMALRFKAEQPQFTKAWAMCWYLISTSTDRAFKNAMTEQYNFFAERNI